MIAYWMRSRPAVPVYAVLYPVVMEDDEAMGGSRIDTSHTHAKNT